MDHTDYVHVEEPGIKVTSNWIYYGVRVMAQPVDANGEPVPGKRIDLNYFKPAKMRVRDRSRY